MIANQADFPIRAQCRVLKVSASGYYAWLQRPPSARSRRHAALGERIRAIHAESDATYGSPKVRAELMDPGETISRKLVAKLMQQADLQGVSRRRGFVVTTQRDPANPKAPDLVQRQFVAQVANQLWVADMTYIPTWVGFIYLAAVINVWSRRVVGWSIGEHMRTELVLAARNMAVTQRRPEAVIHHSDQGSQCTALAFGKRCGEMGGAHPWAAWAMLTTTPWPRVSSPTWNANGSTGAASSPRSRPDSPCSPGSRAGTTRAGATPRWATFRPITSRRKTAR